MRLVHSFIWDGDAENDFLAGLGLRVSVPLRAALHDRHVRIAGADGGVFAEAVRGITGLRRDPGEAVRAAQVAGIPIGRGGTVEDVAEAVVYLAGTGSRFANGAVLDLTGGQWPR